MKLKTYILIVIAISAIGFSLLFMGERDTALIFFGILAGFFTNVLNLDKGEEKDELDSIMKDLGI